MVSSTATSTSVMYFSGIPGSATQSGQATNGTSIWANNLDVTGFFEASI